MERNEQRGLRMGEKGFSRSTHISKVQSDGVHLDPDVAGRDAGEGDVLELEVAQGTRLGEGPRLGFGGHVVGYRK